MTELQSLYCPMCKTHTAHRNLVNQYATVCTICWCQTNQLMRLQAESFSYTAPDGTKATVVENTPDEVTFYVPSGEFAGYYLYNKTTKKREIREN
jgi:hypothetical protein